MNHETELENAISELSSFGEGVEPTQDMIDVCKTLDVVLAAAKENKMLRAVNAQLVASEQSMRNESNRLRAKVRELEGRIANALL